MSNTRNLGNLTPANTYGQLVQIVNGVYYDGLGNPLTIGQVGPQGPAGPQGPIGPTGPSSGPGTGVTGATGPKGPTGATGPQGNNGQDGPIGPVGPIGPTGSQGIIGPTGSQGIQGVTGPTGSQGIQGNIGPTGSQGIQGVTGATGFATASAPLVVSGNVLSIQQVNSTQNGYLSFSDYNYFNSIDPTVVHLSGTESISGLKTFANGTLLLRNVANTFNGVFLNTVTANRTYTLQDRSGTLADLTDIAGRMEVPSGTMSYMAKFISATAIGNSILYDYGYGVGIGLTNSNTGTLLDIKSTTENSTVFNVQGLNGQLFSVTDNMFGDIHTVNDISGLPLWVVNSNNKATLYGDLYINSLTIAGVSASTNSIYTISTSNGNAAFFDYYISETSGTNAYRAGTIQSVWDGTNITYNEQSTGDLNAVTNGLSFTLTISGGNVNLNVTRTSGIWKIKISSRII